MSSITEVARQAGVSTATVSRTFSTPDLLSHQTRRRVLEVAERLNYSPRRRQITRTKARNVVPAPEALGFLFFASDADISEINDFYAPVLYGAQAEAALLGMHMIVRTVSRYRRPDALPKLLDKEAVGGMLLVGAALPEVLDCFVLENTPAVLVDNRAVTGKYDAVISDSLMGALEATRHLIRLGHRRIGFLMNEPTAPSFQDRLRGYLSAHWEAGLTPSPSAVLIVEDSEGLEARLQQAIRGANHLTALVAANDINALNAIKACRLLEINVPREFSIIGFDDMPFCSHAYPTLTTMRIEKEQMGRVAVRRLWSRLEERADRLTCSPPLQLVLPVSLVPRDSCGPPPLSWAQKA